MTRDPILFRVDGTAERGWDQLARCLVLAAALQRRRRPTYFLAQLEPGALALAIKRAGNDWLPSEHPVGSNEDLAQMRRAVLRLRPAAVIIDAQEAEEDYLQDLAALGTMVVSMDNVAGSRLPARLVINPLLGQERDAYEVGPRTQLLLGARYALVRPEVRRIRPIRAQEPAQPFRGLVALGDDPNNQSGDLAKLLLNCPKVGRVDIAIRPQHPQLEELQALAANCPERLEVVTEMPEVAARIARAHFAVTAGNAWSLELACVGVPQLIVVQNEVYRPTAQQLEEEGAAVCLGWHASLTAATFRQAVQNLLADDAERQAMARCGRQLIDGRGPDRLVTALEVLLHPAKPLPLSQAA